MQAAKGSWNAQLGSHLYVMQTSSGRVYITARYQKNYLSFSPSLYPLTRNVQSYFASGKWISALFKKTTITQKPPWREAITSEFGTIPGRIVCAFQFPVDTWVITLEDHVSRWIILNEQSKKRERNESTV